MENIDMTQKVAPEVSSFLGAGGILIISVIFVFMFIFIKRYKAKALPLLFGVLGYILFGFMGYNLLVSLVIMIPGMQNIYESNATVLLVLFSLISVLVYTAARILISQLLCDRAQSPGDVFNAGLGLGVGEALLYSFSVIMMLTWCTAINSQGLEVIFKDFTPQEIESTYRDISGLFTSPSVLWLLLGLSHIMNIVMNIGLMMLTYGVVLEKLPKYWYGISALMNFMIILPFQIYDDNSLVNIAVLFLIKTLVFVGCVFVIIKTDKNHLGGMLSFNVKTASSGPMPKFGKLSNK